MDKIVFICICMLFVCQTINAAYEQQWRVAKAKYGLSFKDAKAERTAFNTYAKNMEMIEQKNAFGNLGYDLAENQFTHLTEQQIQEQYLIKPEVLESFLNRAYKKVSPAEVLPPVGNGNTIPDCIDFGYTLNPAKDQGQCGSCYTFSATAVMESQYFLKYKTKISLSEQQLVDCTYNSVSGNFGCYGGWTDKCLRYANVTGVVSSSQYPYSTSLSTCKTSIINAATNKVFVSETANLIIYNDELTLKNVVALMGPISVYIQAVGDFFSYRSGIMNNTACTGSINHAVTLVGYGTDGGKDFWLIRNSWGTGWGINGYAKMIRNSNNNCKIASYPIYAKVK